MKTFASIVLAAFAAVVRVEAAGGAEEEPHFFYTAVPGRFALIGQEPDGGAAYKGTAKITFTDGRLILLKQIEGNNTTAEGGVERAGESEVVRFRWPGHEETCLVRLDLDNYSRLSCYWTVDGETHKKPGLEAYFPTETWP